MKLNLGQTRWQLSLVALTLCAIFCGSCALFNNVPLISSVQSQKEWVDVLHSTEVTCVASDPDEDELTYLWTATSGNISGQGSTVTWTAPDTPGTYAITVTVMDGRGGEAAMQLTIDVLVNNPPVIESLATERCVIYPAESTPIECVAFDPDGDELTYLWEATGGDISGQGSTADWTAPDTVGTYNIIVTVTDGRDGEASQELNITVITPGGGG